MHNTCLFNNAFITILLKGIFYFCGPSRPRRLTCSFGRFYDIECTLTPPPLKESLNEKYGCGGCSLNCPVGLIPNFYEAVWGPLFRTRFESLCNQHLTSVRQSICNKICSYFPPLDFSDFTSHWDVYKRDCQSVSQSVSQSPKTMKALRDYVPEVGSCRYACGLFASS